MNLYSSFRWRTARARAIERDGDRCTVSRWLGGACAPGPFHVHHIHAVGEGGAPYSPDNLGTACASHHPMWESLRRLLVRQMTRPAPRCHHWHPTREARELCERRLARRERHTTVAA